MRDLMLDWETWGRTPDAVVRSLALVMFNERRALERMLIDARPSVDNQLEHGRIIDPKTVGWWRKQPLSLTSLLQHYDPMERADNISQITGLIGEFCEQHKPERVWSRRSFDMWVTRDLFLTFGEEPPWKYYQEQDCATFDCVVPKVRAAHPHDPLSDAIAQIEHVQVALANYAPEMVLTKANLFTVNDIDDGEILSGDSVRRCLDFIKKRTNG